jgi:glycerol uptake facilitator protein
MTPFLAEIIGTAFLILLGNGVVANVVLNKTKGNNSGWIVITLGWSIAVFVGVYISAAYSGAHINPAVTIALATAGKFDWAFVPAYIGAQFIGAMIGAFLVWVTYKKHFDETADADAKLAVFCNSPAIKNTAFNLATEIIATFALVFGVFYIAGAHINDVEVKLGSLDALPVA